MKGVLFPYTPSPGIRNPEIKPFKIGTSNPPNTTNPKMSPTHETKQTSHTFPGPVRRAEDGPRTDEPKTLSTGPPMRKDFECLKLKVKGLSFWAL